MVSPVGLEPTTLCLKGLTAPRINKLHRVLLSVNECDQLFRQKDLSEIAYARYHSVGFGGGHKIGHNLKRG